MRSLLEVNGVKDEANQAIADTVTEWRNSIIDEYSASLAEEGQRRRDALGPDSLGRTNSRHCLLMSFARSTTKVRKRLTER